MVYGLGRLDVQGVGGRDPRTARAGEFMNIDPVIPGWWDGFRIIYRHGESVYEVHVNNPDHCENASPGSNGR